MRFSPNLIPFPRFSIVCAASSLMYKIRSCFFAMSTSAGPVVPCGPKANDSAALSGSDWRTGELGDWSTHGSRAVKLNLVGDRWRTPKLRELNNWRPRRPDYPATGGRPSTRNSRTVPVDQLGIQAREMPEDWTNCTSPELRQLLAPTDPRSSSLSVSQLKNSRTATRDWQSARRLEAGSNCPD